MTLAWCAKRSAMTSVLLNAYVANGFVTCLCRRTDEEFTSYTEREVSLDFGGKILALSPGPAVFISSEARNFHLAALTKVEPERQYSGIGINEPKNWGASC
jgi:hypothetical protein